MQVRLVVIMKKPPKAADTEELTLLSAATNRNPADYAGPQPPEETYIWKRMHSSLPAAKAAVTRLSKKYPDNKYFIGTITWGDDD